MTFLSIPKPKFDAYFYGRTPYVKLFSEEQEWMIFERDGITLLAVVLKCLTDNDLNAVILGRDLSKKFRAIHVIPSIETRDALIKELNSHIHGLVNSHVDGLFPQGDEGSQSFAIFNPKIPEHKRHHYFKLLTDDPTHFPARVMMEELAHWFNDPDGIFIRALQGNEFNARLFELYLHAVFYELDFHIDRSFPQPDYVLSKAGQVISIEAATVSENEAADVSMKIDEVTIESLIEHADQEMPFRFARTLLNKVKHRPEPEKVHYWELPHTAGHPFLIAVQDYSKKMSMAFSSAAMQSYLYGISEKDGKTFTVERHEIGTRSIPSSFFAADRHRYISAVLLSTGATVPKFNRMARIAGIRSPNSFAKVVGIRTDGEGNLREFSSLAEHPDYREYWHEGIYIFCQSASNSFQVSASKSFQFVRLI